jgi:hypothetical protein
VQTAQQRAVRYQAEAERLRREAEMTRDPTIRQQYIEIAGQYETLARCFSDGLLSGGGLRPGRPPAQ